MQRRWPTKSSSDTVESIAEKIGYSMTTVTVIDRPGGKPRYWHEVAHNMLFRFIRGTTTVIEDGLPLDPRLRTNGGYVNLINGTHVSQVNRLAEVEILSHGTKVVIEA